MEASEPAVIGRDGNSYAAPIHCWIPPVKQNLTRRLLVLSAEPAVWRSLAT
jgi:hypothetical protein